MKELKNITVSRTTLGLVCCSLAGLSLFLFSGCAVVVKETPGHTMPQDFQDADVKRYIMKQKLLTLGERFVIRNEYREPMFYIKGKPFSFGDKLQLFDMEGNELAYIKQKVFSFKKLYKIYRDQQLFAKVMKTSLFKNKFVVDVPGPADYLVKGNFIGYRYAFFRNGSKVAAISKKWPSWSDSYTIEIVPGEDDVIILATAVILDMINHNEEHHHHSHQ